MSKAKSRKKKKELAARKAQSGQALLRNGKKAFDQQNYDKAIETWKRGYKNVPTPELKSALAEAYFRRGMLSENEADVQTAAQYTPDDARIAYHIGNIHQQNGEHEQALSRYQAVINDETADSALINQAAYAICLQTNDKEAWGRLTPKQQALLTHSQQLRRRPYTLTDDMPILYKAFVAYDEERFDEADQLFTAALAEAPSKQAEGIIQQHLGNIAVHKDKLLVGLVHWQQAHQFGVNDPTFITNLTEMYTRMAEDALAQQQTKRARQLANEGLRLSPDDKRLRMLVGHLTEWDGLEAANKAQWKEAETIWHQTELENGANFRLLYNLAIVREKMEQPELAAETWRNALKRRPRKADHPDALKPAQTAQLWQRVADNYVKAGEFDEALKVYQTAIKHDGDNLPLRQAYAEGLMTEGRLQAAENEFGRILERDPNNIPALLRLGEVRAEIYYASAQRYIIGSWERVLELDPNHAEARELLANHYTDYAKQGLGWYPPANILKNVNEGLKYAPDSFDLWGLRTECAVQMDNMDELPNSLWKMAECSRIIEEYLTVASLCLNFHFEDLAWKTINRAKENIGVTLMAYIAIGATGYSGDGGQYAKKWFNYALEHQDDEPDFDVLSEIIQALLNVDGGEDAAREYMAQIAGNKSYKVHLIAYNGILAAKEGDTKEAEKLLDKAERMAKRNNHEELLDLIGYMRFKHLSPFGGMSDMMLRMMENMSPAEIERMMNMIGNMDEGDFF